MVNNIRRAINRWLWTHDLATLKQYPVTVERYKVPRLFKRGFVVGFMCGLVPYIVHMGGWLR